MLFFSIMLAAFAVAWLIPSHGQRRPVREAARAAIGIAFVVAGASHFLTPTPFVQHLPTWVPERHAIIYLSGLAEIGGGLALLALRHWRRQIALALALYLVIVFPANVYVAVADVAIDGQPNGVWSWVRLPFQAVYIWWLLWSTTAQAAAGHGLRRREVAAQPSG